MADKNSQDMIVGVVGLWHLGSVTASCLASVCNTVIAYDPDELVISNFQQGIMPVFEPGLEQLVNTGVKSGKLKFTNNKEFLHDADIIWVTFDTPVDDNDIADVEFVKNQVISLFPYCKNNAIILISSQLPVGTSRDLQTQLHANFPELSVNFAYSPENLRLGKAIDVFTTPDRVVIGIDSDNIKPQLEQLFAPFCHNLLWMKLESAEMTKHALNAFLATSVVFINELAALCEQVGADAFEVERGLKSESRIGTGAYLKPGDAFAGGTLARDVSFLIQIGQHRQLPTQLFSAVIESNQLHKKWVQRRLLDVFGNLSGRKIAILGLTYKPGTDTLRRSGAIETCKWLLEQGAVVPAYDPVIRQLGNDLQVRLCHTVQDAVDGADAVVIATAYPEFKQLTATDFIGKLNQPMIFDSGGFLATNLKGDKRLCYFTVGSC